MSGMNTTIDKGSSVPKYSSVCAFCRHLDRGSMRRCAAFAGEIPLEIWLGENGHRAPYPGDNGTTFEWAPNVAPDVRARVEKGLPP